MVRRTAAQWHAPFAACGPSGLSYAAFRKEHGLCPKYFGLRRKRLGAFKKPISSPPIISPFIRAEVMTPQISIELSVKATHLALPVAISPAWMANLLKALT